ncbi:MAG: alpha/beta hydrolase [Polaromonas sp.]|nr:alpha/beta hydrolase [Polaromonas sp.]
MYKEKRTSRSEFVPIRGLSYHLRIWQGNNPSGTLPPLVLVHGWMDVAASYQFMVDALSDAFATGRTIIAPDWRGFGLTKSVAEGEADNYWFPDYLADLDFLLDHYVKDQKVDLVGHSMGGNVAMIYAGVRPERIRRLVNLEGFGLAPSKPAQAPTRYAKWIDELKTLHKGELDLKAYDEVSGVAKRLMKTNPRLSEDKANWLASHWAQQNAAGQWLILGEPGHKVVSANIYRVEETLEIYKRITAPVLAVEASEDSLEKWNQGRYTLADYHERLKLIADAKVAVVDDAGHMLHHDQPEALAKLIEGFLN